MKPSRIEREAAKWLIELDTAANVAEHWPKFEEWLKQGPEYEAAFKSMEEAWKGVKDLQVFHINHSNQMENPLFTPRRDIPFVGTVRNAALWAAAAALVVVLGVGLIRPLVSGRWAPVQSASWQTYLTGIGEHRSVHLADGSVMEMNTNTLLRVNRASDGREVMLDRGEALFDVKKDPSHPFLVYAGKSHVQALGTRFSVWRRSDVEAVTVVQNGSVGVTQTSHAPVLVSANEIATIRPNGVAVTKVDAETINRKLSWENGELRFNGETLAEAVEAFNRYNPTQLKIDDVTIAQQRIGGSFQANDPLGFADLLERLFRIHHVLETLGNSQAQVIHLSRANPGAK